MAQRAGRIVTIRRLPPEVTGKIAAGEVIERPASVIKELIENSLDAGAKSIQIDFEDGGRRLIRVVDDGSGIPPGELREAVERHCTSKLRSENDLLSIRTLGFRGEALCSISAVAELGIASRPKDVLVGRKIVVHGEQVIADEPQGGAAGTEVVVSRLFENFPVRMEFLKSDRTETFHILNVARNLALARPSVGFAASADGRPSFSTPGTGSLEDCLLALYGAELVDTLLPIEPGKWLGIDGFVSKPGRDWANRGHISFFVNGRWVGNPTLSAALAEAYRGLMPAGRHPAAFLHLELPPDEVDVNIHPAKAEVRFRDSGRLFSRLSSAIRRTLIERSDFVPVEIGDTRPVVDSFFIPSRLPQSPSQDLTNTSAQTRPSPSPHSPAPSIGDGQITSPHMRALGQIDRTYIVAAGPDGLYLIDQHTAHERVLYEELLSSNDTPDRQQLLEGQSVELGAPASAWLEENGKLLSGFGIDARNLGGTTWIVNTVPSMAAGRQAGGFLEELVGDLSTVEGRRSDSRERARWGVACKSAVKSGEGLSVPEMQALIEQLLECDLGRTCPHGRPTTLKLSRELLDQQFGRT